MILVTFTNKRPGDPILGVLDQEMTSLSPVELPRDLWSGWGMTGAAVSGDMVYVAVQWLNGSHRRSGIVALERETLRFVGLNILTYVRDPHAMLAVEDRVYVVSTGTDEVYELYFDGPKLKHEGVIWQHQLAEREDVHHLNGLCLYRGHLVVSGIGKDRKADDGFIYDIPRRREIVRGLAHPHSLVAQGWDLHFCESQERVVRDIRGRRSETLPGYARGLCRVGESFFVGTSEGRRISKSTGKPVPIDEGWKATISRLDRSMRIETTLDISGAAREIYALVPI